MSGLTRECELTAENHEHTLRLVEESIERSVEDEGQVCELFGENADELGKMIQKPRAGKIEA